MPFRYLDGDRQFDKYQIVEVDAARNRHDPRPESYRINAESLRLGEAVKGWPKRVPLVEPLVTESMCAVLAAVRRDPNAPSLALIRPREVLALRIEPHPGWTARQQAVLDQWASQPELFGIGSAKQAIQAPRFLAKYRYRCAEATCRTHEQGILDWELTALQRRLAHQSDDALRAAITNNFHAKMCAPDRAAAFFVGNQADAAKRQTFSVLGTYYPKALDAATLPLF